MPLSAEFIERLKTANPIADVMGTYVNLKRTGRDYICLCPFHNEKTPSCVVHPDKEYFHCFGCGAGGDVITFTMRYNNLDYWEAIKFLAERGGIDLPEDDQYKRGGIDKRKRIYEMNKKVARFFYDKLRSDDGKKCREYLVKRGLTAQIIMKYGIGYAPNSWSELKNFMLSEGYSEHELEEASFISRSQRNTKKTFDFFVDRVMFPFFDLRGNIVGFGGRALGNEDKRKYLNSKDTPVYNKNKYLFSMNFAKNISVKEGKILLCEGNLDVISLNQAGFENAVASCGTALTPEQAKLISNYADEVVICYDSDEAGQKATKKAINILGNVGLKVKVIKMEGAKDPDEYLNKFGVAKFKHMLNHSEGAINFELSKAAEGIDLLSEVGKTEYMKKVCMIIQSIRSPIERDIYMSKIAREQGVSKQSIELQIENLDRLKRKKEFKKREQDVLSFANRRDPLNPDAYIYPRENMAEQQLIYYVYVHPDKCEEISEMISDDCFATSLNKKIYTNLIRKIKNNEDYSFSSFNDEFSNDEVGRITSIINDYKDKGIDEKVINDCIHVLMEYFHKKNNKKNEEMSDNDFRSYLEELRRKKFSL